jgi:opacity protein-like surface antigen
MKQFLSVLLIAVLFTGFINAQGKIALGVQGGIAIPTSLGDSYKMGFGGQGNFAYHISPMIDIVASVGYLTWSGKVADVSFSSVPVLAGARYYFGKGNFNPYVTAELGIHFETAKTPTITIPFLGTTVGGSTSGSDFGFGAGAGFLYQLSPKLDLDVNAKYSSISGTGSSFSNLVIMAGVLVAL